MVDMFGNTVTLGDCVVVNLDNVSEWHGLALAKVTALKENLIEVQYLKNHDFIVRVLHEKNLLQSFEVVKVGSLN